MLAEGRVGAQSGADGAQREIRLGKTGEVIAGNAHAWMYEAASRGNVFAVANQTGFTSQAGLSATTPGLTLFNPKGSGVNGVLLYAGVIQTVAFAAASTIMLAANVNIAAADVTGTEATPRNTLLGNNKKSAIQAYTAATLPAAPVAIAHLGSGLTGAITTVPAQAAIGRLFDGAIILAPGSAISIQTSTASGASGLFAEYVFEEVPLT
jgi:hypothetical protein